MQPTKRAFSTGTIVLLVILVVLIALPWTLSMAFAPLRPVDLETTATVYVTIASDYQTVQAIKEGSRTSVMVLEPTQTPDPITPTKSARSDSNVQFVAFAVQAPTATIGATGTVTAAATAPVTRVAVSPTATIKLPKISTATPLPPVAKQLLLTDETATQDIQKTQKDIQNLKLTILADSIQITGTVIVDGPLGTKIGVSLEIIGTLSVEAEKLRFKVTSVKVNGGDETNTERGKQAEGIVNDWLTGYLIRKKVQKLTQQPGLLTLDILELSTSDLPTLRPTAAVTLAGTVAPTAAVTTFNTRAVVGSVTVPPTGVAIVITSGPTSTRRLIIGTVTVVPRTAAVTHIAVSIKTSVAPTATVATIIPSRTAVTVAAPADATSGPSPTVKLPQVTQQSRVYGSGTPQPTITINPNAQNTITGEQATLLTGGTLGPITDVNVTFDKGTIIVTGNVTLPNNPITDPITKVIAPGKEISVPIQIIGILTVKDGKPSIQFTSIKLADKEVGSNTPVGQAAMSALGDYVTNVLIPGKVSKVTAENDTLVTDP